MSSRRIEPEGESESESAHSGQFRYRAFLSYSHTDRRWGRWLLRKLEGYRVPGRLVGQETPAGPAPARLAPIFRDRDELPTSPDLGREIHAALADSAALIVICSPAAAASRWVNEEILEFRRLGRSDRVFCFVVDGESGGSHETEPFPAATRFQLGGDHNWTKATITIELDNSDGLVTQAADGSLTVSGATTMNFAFWQPSNSCGLERDPGYPPVGIYFLEDASNPSRSDPEGMTDFPSCTVSTQIAGTTSYRNMQVCAADTTKGLNGEFYIVLQRVSDGKLGIIDPKVRNQP